MTSTPRTAPEWFGIAKLMDDMSTTLPPDWDAEPTFALDSVQHIAQALVRLRSILPVEELAPLFAAGGLLLAVAKRNAESADITAALLARIADERGGAK